ncbi:hypothetical protein F2Q69_00028118 [Brassica cretica]|uniref:Uncharacterized protein n=1 Tax=Brassica cretica TaxID=69181 RepID=A0A8S9S4U0_BRACR|nr:hypothetical protein F2Q69_00028118 [Brassica cretica]
MLRASLGTSPLFRLRNSYHGDLMGLDLSCGRDSSGSAVLCFVSACDESYPLRLLMGVRFPPTGVQPYIPLLPSASISPVLKLLASLSRFGFSWSVSPPFGSVLHLEWTAVDVIAGPGPSQPCFAYPPVAVAFGTVRGASDCSPVANPYDLFSCCRFRYQDQEIGLMNDEAKLVSLGTWMALFVVFTGRKFTQPIKSLNQNFLARVLQLQPSSHLPEEP